ncbi:uncharacterized protein Z520_07236 [Fonsecaea multimorphosa CBS 102226]|uniref:Zn(2)-C6 fungal-type domain-containing protein n=1 Tax=Fonsecaea multimorphosa CBS 102226 TaxID=1442371 RepID=A0A0D2JUG9_9EURO|nr:uncharacterized protein Z520_07236 [Fonsecaea multimorphosa CBS 102226]KIX97122.1 hypothetical protein Z520_07236 [Fonsecaea multimorphosa CBS 102226]OAL22897.1 hypothetical protein AYO22_06805 [Fonsecaea multimorphosa]
MHPAESPPSTLSPLSVSDRQRAGQQSQAADAIRAQSRAKKGVTHRRATQACLRCRSRKVRCDVTHKAGYCTNCLLDGAECRVIKCRRRGHRTSEHYALQASRNSELNGSANVRSTAIAGEGAFLIERRPETPEETRHSANEWEDRDSTQAGPGLGGLQQSRLTRDGSMPKAQEPQGFILSLSEQPELPATNDTAEQDESPVDRNDGMLSAPSTPPPLPQNDQGSHTALPDFIEAFPLRSPSDLEFLRQRSVFVLPPPPLQRVIMDRFTEFVHPLLPVLDLATFRGALFGEKPGQRVSLLLFHAVMFAGVGAVESEVVLRQAYMSKTTARQTFYEKAKTLFELETEKDRIVICQASLFLIGWASRSNLKDATYWLGTAISQAHVLKLHRSEHVTSMNPPKQQRKRNLRRILWWSILMKECDLCMSIGQPPRVWPFGTPMLTMSDLGLDESGVLGIDSLAPESQQAFDPLPPVLATVCILKAKLCWHIYRIMRNIHEDLSPGDAQPYANPLPFLRQYMVQELYRWRSEIPIELNSKSLLRDGLGGLPRSVAWAVSVVEMIYCAAHFLVHRDGMLLDDMSEHVSPDSVTDRCPPTDYSRCFLRQAANETTEVLEGLVNCGLARFLPPSSMINICLAASTLFRDANSADASTRKTSLQKVDVCIKVSKLLADMAPSMREVVTKMQDARIGFQGRPSRAAPPLNSGYAQISNTTLTHASLEDRSEIDHQSLSGSTLEVSNTGAEDSNASHGYSAPVSYEWNLEEDFGLAGHALLDFDLNGYTWA